MIVIVSCNHSSDDERVYHRQVRSLEKKGYRTIYITRSKLDINLSTDLINHLNYNRSTDLKQYIELVIRIIKKQDRITHIQIHETEILSILKIVKSIFRDIVTIYDVHENMEALYRTFSVRPWPLNELAIKIRKLNEKKHLKYVDRIILANMPLGENPYKRQNIPIEIIQNFPEKKYCNYDLKIRGQQPAIIYHGHLAPERGINDLISAMPEVVGSFHQATLTLLGTFRTSQYHDDVKKLIDQFSLENVVKIHSQVPHKDVWGILKNHTIGVIPFSRNPLTEENTPTKLFEMMASGLDIVSTDLPPVRHFIDDSIYWASPGDSQSLASSIIKAIQSFGESSLIKRNLDLIEKQYNWEIIENRYLNLFKIV